jgi:hypothetical protein
LHRHGKGRRRKKGCKERLLTTFREEMLYRAGTELGLDRSNALRPADP